MADHAVEDDDFDGDIFIYRGGRAPQHITHVLIDESVDEIEDNAFDSCENLVRFDTHDGIRRVGKWAFRYCKSLRRINLKSAIEIDDCAFFSCENLVYVEFGDRLETVGDDAFAFCTSLPHLKLPSITTIGATAFKYCRQLRDVELSGRLETIGESTFWQCQRLQRIAIPPKRFLFALNFFQRYSQFKYCGELTTVDLVGGIHETVASLHMDSWRAEMNDEINRINQVLPNTRIDEKTEEIQQWMHSVVDKMDHYKDKHYRHVKEGITLLELALWKAKLDEKEDRAVEPRTKKARIDTKDARKERRITSGAFVVIKNVLPFLQLE